MSEYVSSSFPDVAKARAVHHWVCAVCSEPRPQRSHARQCGWIPLGAQFHYVFSLKLNFGQLHLQKPLILVKNSVIPMLSYSIPYGVTAFHFRSWAKDQEPLGGWRVTPLSRKHEISPRILQQRLCHMLNFTTWECLSCCQIRLPP